MAILEVKNLKKIYTTRFGGNQVEALRNVNFSAEEGEYTAIMGESGSGKTTLLNILAALDKPTKGTVWLDGKDMSKIRETELLFSYPTEQLKTLPLLPSAYCTEEKSPVSDASKTTAPAPSPNKTQVPLSFQSTKRVMISAPITNTFL